MKRISAVDLFCGAGGTSTGLAQACVRLGLAYELVVVNHWQVAIGTHTMNHPEALHLCQPVETVSARKAVPGGRLRILCASPECTHHSNARGGMPVLDQKRAGAWEILRWVSEIVVDDVLVENVPEFQSWGPVISDRRGGLRPDPKRKGETFRAWVSALRALGYNVEWRVLNCADYGDPTSRRRLFIRARRDGGKIDWPMPTHGAGLRPYRTAREIINWGLKGESIFTRQRPLAPKTIARIAAGLRRFGGEAAEPFLVMLYGTNAARSVDRPAPTITGGGQHVGLCQPFIVGYRGDHEGRDDGSRRVYSPESPLPTVDCSNRYGVVQPFLLSGHGDAPGRAQDRSHDISSPMPTVCASNTLSLVQPFLVKYYGQGQGAASVGRPLDTVTTKERFGLVEPFITECNGRHDPGARNWRIDEPLRTITTKTGFCVVEPGQAGAALDIFFRMLTPRELASAQGFPEDYDFCGNKGDIVRQIGNAVPVNTAAALVEAVLAA